RSDEVVADLATHGPARVHDVAVVVQQPVQPALGADVDAGIGRPIGVVEQLSVRRCGHGEDSRSSNERSRTHVLWVPLLDGRASPRATNPYEPPLLVIAGCTFKSRFTLQPCNSSVSCRITA